MCIPFYIHHGSVFLPSRTEKSTHKSVGTFFVYIPQVIYRQVAVLGRYIIMFISPACQASVGALHHVTDGLTVYLQGTTDLVAGKYRQILAIL